MDQFQYLSTVCVWGALSTALLINFITCFIFAKCEFIANNMFPCQSQVLSALSVFKLLAFHLMFKLESFPFSSQDSSIIVPGN